MNSKKLKVREKNQRKGKGGGDGYGRIRGEKGTRIIGKREKE